MSRSRKKEPFVKDNDGSGKKKVWKKINNRKSRRRFNQELNEDYSTQNDRTYKYEIDPWDIVDFKFRYDPKWGDEYGKAYQYYMK